MCDNDYIWNPSTGSCECYKSCDIKEYLDIENCNCKKKFVSDIVYDLSDECDKYVSKTFDVPPINITLLKNNKKRLVIALYLYIYIYR